jgi:alcohol dehydrogenase class IV
MNGNWNYPTSIRFGAGRTAELPDACRELGMANPLLVTDPGLAALPILADAMAAVRNAGLPLGLFSEIQANPVGADVDRGVEQLRRGDHDGVIAFGGGSALDVAKAIGLMAKQQRPLWDFEDIGDWWTRVDVDAMVPVVAVPTTAGTGSEVGRCSVIVNEAEKRKVLIFHPKILPERVVLDPSLTIGLPKTLTAAVGMDALSHCLEAFCVDSFHPQADGIALEGMRLIHWALQRAVADGSDLEARSAMIVASTMGATAFQKGLGGMHALSHPVSVALHSHHGLTNAIFMPYVLKHNSAAIEEKMVTLSRHLDLPSRGTTAVLDWVLDLRESIGIPHGSADLGFTEAHVDQLAPEALADPSAGGNPLPLEKASMALLYRKALEGSL